MLTPYPTGNGGLIDADSFGSLCLPVEVVNEPVNNRVHDHSLYGNTHIVKYGNTPLQQYGNAHDNLGMELSDRLKKARKEYPGGRVTQGKLAEAVGVDQTTVSDLETGRSFTCGKMVSIARFLKVSPLWLAEGKGDMREKSSSPVIAEDQTNDDYAFIPVLSIKAAAGDGYENVQEVNEGTLAFKREWMQRQGLREEHLRLISACGDSMAPSISDGDMLLVDTSRIDPASGNVYAIRRPDYSLSVKRLDQGFTGEWTIKSDNPDKAKYGDELVGDITAANIPIVGKVVWRGGMM